MTKRCRYPSLQRLPMSTRDTTQNAKDIRVPPTDETRQSRMNRFQACFMMKQIQQEYGMESAYHSKKLPIADIFHCKDCQ